MVELLGYKISKIYMVDNISKAGPLQLKNNIKFAIDYAQDNESAVATLLSTTEYKDSSMFSLVLEMQAIFKVCGIKNIGEKEEATLMCYDELFYYLEQVMAYLISNTGLEGFKLRKPDIMSRCVDLDISKSNDESSGKIIEFSPD